MAYHLLALSQDTHLTDYQTIAEETKYHTVRYSITFESNAVYQTISEETPAKFGSKSAKFEPWWNDLGPSFEISATLHILNVK